MRSAHNADGGGALRAHLSAILFPDTLRRLYIARDDDPAGDGAMATLIDRAQEARIEAIVLSPRLGDFNEDLRLLGLDALRAACGCKSCRRTSPASWRWRHRPQTGQRLAATPVPSGPDCQLPFRVGEDHAHGLLRGRSGGKRSGPAMAVADYFPSAAEPPLHRETK